MSTEPRAMNRIKATAAAAILILPMRVSVRHLSHTPQRNSKHCQYISKRTGVIANRRMVRAVPLSSCSVNRPLGREKANVLKDTTTAIDQVIAIVASKSLLT